MKDFENIERKRVTFDKCIDKEASMTFSARLYGQQKVVQNENSMQVANQADLKLPQAIFVKE